MEADLSQNLTADLCTALFHSVFFVWLWFLCVLLLLVLFVCLLCFCNGS